MRNLSGDQKHRIKFVLNGKPVSGFAEPRMLLSDFLRQEMALTGGYMSAANTGSAAPVPFVSPENSGAPV